MVSRDGTKRGRASDDCAMKSREITKEQIVIKPLQKLSKIMNQVPSISLGLKIGSISVMGRPKAILG